MINVINTLINLGKLEQAQKECLEFLKMFPGDTNLLTQLGELYFLQKKYDESYQHLLKAIQSDVNNGRALNKMGEVFLQRQNLTKAKEFFQRAQRINPSLKNLNYNLALLAEASGDFEGAGKFYRQELAANPRSIKSAYNMAEIHRKRKSWDEAVEYYQKCIQINPRFNIPYFMIAKIYFDQGIRVDEATELCLKGVKIKPVDKYTAFGYFILADIFDGKDQQKSRRYLSRANQIMRDIENRIPRP
jgi:tetratricopeptide (TPR) repeat protein